MSDDLTYLVPVSNSLHSLDQFILGQRLVQGQVSVQLDVVRHRGVRQLVQAGEAQLLQHRPHGKYQVYSPDQTG